MKLAAFLFITSLAHAASCDSLSSLSLPNTTILLAQDVAAGAFTPSPAPGRAGGGRGGNFTDLPAFCRMQASAKPTSDSDIRIEVWLPVAASWNGKLRGTGNGGLGGGTGANPGALATAMRLGYATVGSNTGHEGDSSYAMDHPEKIKDFGYRSAHEMTVTAKALINAYCGQDPPNRIGESHASLSNLSLDGFPNRCGPATAHNSRVRSTYV